MFEDFEDEYAADPDVPVTSKLYQRLRAVYARLKARHLKFAHLAQMGAAEGWPAGKVATYKKKAEGAAKRAKRVHKRLEKERLRLEAMSSESGASMLAEQGAADECGHELLSVPVSAIPIQQLDPEEMDEGKAVAIIAGTSFGYIDYAQFDPKTQMLLDMGYQLEDFSVDARLDAQLRQLEEMGISTEDHMSGDDLYSQWPTLDYAVPSDVADAGMFSGDTDFLNSHAPVGLWEDGTVDEFESGDVSMGAFDVGGGGSSAAKLIYQAAGKVMARPVSTYTAAAKRQPVDFTATEGRTLKKISRRKKALRSQIAQQRKVQVKNSKATTVHSRKLARERRNLKRERARLKLLRRWKRGPLRGKYVDPLRASILRKRIGKLAPGVRNSNKRLRKLNRSKAKISQTILRLRGSLAKVHKQGVAIRAAAHARAGNQKANAESTLAVSALDAVIKKTMEEQKVVMIAEEASDRLLEAQDVADVVLTKEIELEVLVSETDLEPKSLATPEIAKAEEELKVATENSGYSLAGIFEAIQALSDQMDSSLSGGNPVFQDNPEPIEAGEGGFIDVPEDWDANYYEPEWEDEQGYQEDQESIEFQTEAAQNASPDHGQEWDDQQLRLDDQLAQLAAMGVSISGDSYGLDPWDQFGDDISEGWPTLDYAVPSDVADAGMFSGDTDFLNSHAPVGLWEDGTVDEFESGDVSMGDGYGDAFGGPFKLNWNRGGGTGAGAGAATTAPTPSSTSQEAPATEKKEKPSVGDVFSVLTPLINAGLNFGANLINGAGKGGSGNAAPAANTAAAMKEAAVSTQPMVYQPQPAPATAEEIAAAVARTSSTTPEKEETNIWPWVGVSVMGVGVLGTAVWASTR